MKFVSLLLFGLVAAQHNIKSSKTIAFPHLHFSTKNAETFCAKYKVSSLNKLPRCSININGVEGLFVIESNNTDKLTWVYYQYQSMDKSRILSVFDLVLDDMKAYYGPPSKIYDKYHLSWEKYNVTISLEYPKNAIYLLLVTEG